MKMNGEVFVNTKWIKTLMALTMVAVLTVCFFGCGKKEQPSADAGVGQGGIDIAADNSDKLVSEQEAVSGGTSQEMVDSFSGDSASAALTVNGEPVDAGVLNFAVNDMAIRYAQSLMFTGVFADVEKFDWNAKDPNYDGSYLDYVKYTAMEELIPRYAMVAEGKRRGITLTAEEKQQVQDWLKNEQGSLSLEEFEAEIQKAGCPGVQELVSFREFSMLEAKVYEDFKTNPEKYATREQLMSADERELVTVKHILISFDPENTGNVTDEMKADARKRAEEVLAKVNAGENFEELIAEYNDDPGATDEGYTFADDGTMVQEFTDASFALQVGENSGLVETTYGYHIIKRYERAITVTDYIILLNKNAKIVLNNSVFGNMTVTVDIDEYLDSVMRNMIGG